MSNFDVPGATQDVFERNLAGLQRLADRFSADAGFRAKAEQDATDAFRAEGFDIPAGYQVQLHANTPSVMYVVMPPDPNAELADERLETVAGGSTVSSAGSALTASTAVCSCAPSSASTASSSGTAGSISP